MNELNRREFLKKLGIGASGLALGSLAISLQGCSNDKSTKNENELKGSQYVAIRISSDLYKSTLLQRFAFVIFEKETHLSKETLSVNLKKPSGKLTQIKNIRPRVGGLKSQGIYSFETIFDEAGNYEISTSYDKNPVTLTFNVSEVNLAPGLDTNCINTDSPTNADPKDAKILCTRFDGECGLHKNSISNLLSQNAPFLVLFATPARCQTKYCGPVLDILKSEVEKNPINCTHIEIYKDETSPDVLDAVTEWGLPSEPWLFAVDKSGIIKKRLDGAFYLSEIKDSIDAIKI